MNKAAVIIPNMNGMAFLPDCLASLSRQSDQRFSVWLIDNGSTDESVEFVRSSYPDVHIVELGKNTGFCYATNTGIRQSREPYVIFLNNDTVCRPDFVRELLKAVEKDPRIFSCGAKMLQMDHEELCDDAGDFYNALGWAFARGKGKPASGYTRPCRIFSACGGAAIYRRSMLEEIGLLDEAHFAYLEDLDLGWRAQLKGYVNRFAPDAVVLHKGSGSSGSRHNAFKVRLSSRNSVYVIRKNMPLLQIILNAPLLAAGFAVKAVYFARKGLGREYIRGLARGLRRDAPLLKNKTDKISFTACARIQLSLWTGLFRMLQ